MKIKLPSINLSRKAQMALLVACGAVVGAGAYFMYALRFHTYLGNDPSACVNCHIMAPYYDTWQHSSHARNTTCNDCHVPHDNFVKKYFFKGKDGMGHVFAFLTHSENDAIFAKDESAEVIMNNCIRCHTQLNQEFVKTGRIDYMTAKKGEGKACWDCHRNVPHGKVSLSSTQNAIVPYPPSPVPDWLNNKIKGKK